MALKRNEEINPACVDEQLDSGVMLSCLQQVVQTHTRRETMEVSVCCFDTFYHLLCACLC